MWTAFSFKYRDIYLPTLTDDIHGYHHICNKAFTSTQKKYLDKNEASRESHQPENATSQLETLYTIKI